MKVLITGAAGQLGADLVKAYDAHEVVALTSTELDVAVEADVFAAVTDTEPGLVVNAAAWTDVDGCEADPARAHRVNALGPWWLARACDLIDATLVTISTDYVFDGSADRPYTEFDPVAPASVYGRSKAAGEQLVAGALRQHHIVRTAWLAGSTGNNFVRTMLRVGEESGAVSVVDDQVGSPTTTTDLAAAIVEVGSSGRYGIVNRTNTGHCSWHDLASHVFDRAGMDVTLTRQSSDALGRPAPRPQWSVLDSTHAEAIGLAVMRPWQEAIDDLLVELGASS